MSSTSSLPALPPEPDWFTKLPVWLQVAVATVVAAIALWVFVTVLKWTLRFAIIAILFVGLATAVWLLFNRGAF